VSASIPEAGSEVEVTATDEADRAIAGDSPVITTMSADPLGLIAHYRFNEGCGNTVADHTKPES